MRHKNNLQTIAKHRKFQGQWLDKRKDETWYVLNMLLLSRAAPVGDEQLISMRPPQSMGGYFIYFLLFSMSFHGASATAVEKNMEINAEKTLNSLEVSLKSEEAFGSGGVNKYSFFNANGCGHNVPGYLKKEERDYDKSQFFKKTKTSRKKANNANALIRWVVENAPYKFNQEYGSTLIASESQMAVEYHDIDSAQAELNILRKNKLAEFSALVKENQVALGLEHELYKQAMSDPIYTSSKEEGLAITKEYKAIEKYLTEIHTHMIVHELLPYFQGGNCGTQTQGVIIEALRKDCDIELVKLTDHEGQAHIFGILGRNRHLPLNKTNLLSDEAMNDDAMLIDYWLNDRVISGLELKKNPKSFGLYFYKNWQWEITVFSPKIPENIKSPYYKRFPQLQRHFDYCQDKLIEILKNGLVLPKKPSNLHRAQML